MKIIPLLLSLLLFSSCIIYTRDRSRAVHPTIDDTMEIVYVHTKGMKNAVNVYPVGEGAVPIWCDVEQKYRPVVQKMFAVCYSGKKPPVSELSFSHGLFLEPPAKGVKGPFSIEEQLNPFGKAYSFSVSIAPSNYDEFLVFYFDLYRSFCQRDGISCCMTGDGKDFVFDLVIEDPDGVKQLYREIDSVVSYIKNGHHGYQGTELLYDLFSSFIYDKCSFNKWYYDAISAGIVMPESFMNIKKWKEFENRTFLVSIKRIDIKLVDYQKVPVDEKGWLNSNLKNLEPALQAR